MNSSSSDATDADPAPRRIVLSPEDMTAGFVALGKAPPGGTLFADLPPYQGSLPERLVDRGGALSPGLAAMFEILADPGAALILDIFVPGNASFVSTHFLWRDEPPYLVLARTADGQWDLASLATPAELLAVADGLLGLTRIVSRDAVVSVTLTVPALVALVAFGDLVQEEELEQRLARTPAPPLRALEPVAVDELQRMVEQGLAAPDMRWGATLTELLSDGEIGRRASADEIEQGLDDLVALGLFSEDRDATTEAIGLARILCAPTLAASITAATARGDGALDRLVVYRTPLGLLAGLWATGPEGRTLTLAEKSAASILEILGDAVTDGANAGAGPSEAAAPNPA